MLSQGGNGPILIVTMVIGRGSSDLCTVMGAPKMKYIAKYEIR